MLSVPDCIRDRVWFAVPQPTEREHVGDQIDAAMIFAGPDFVNVHFPRACGVTIILDLERQEVAKLRRLAAGPGIANSYQ
jgi:hypothetical protein